MILLLDTSTPTCKLWLVEGDVVTAEEWEANRQLANGLLSYVETTLQKREKTWHDITGLGVYRGPGSFTGLRIGMTIVNTLADSLKVPIVGTTGDNWREKTLSRLKAGHDDKLVLPAYGREANTTQPRK